MFMFFTCYVAISAVLGFVAFITALNDGHNLKNALGFFCLVMLSWPLIVGSLIIEWRMSK